MNKLSDDDYSIHEINVTPFVDIMLVLLVIFMVTATFVVKQAIDVELPKAASGGEIANKTFAVAIDEYGQTFLDGSAVDDRQLTEKITNAKQIDDGVQAIIAADQRTNHGAVIHVLDVLKVNGITKFAIQIEKSN